MNNSANSESKTTYRRWPAWLCLAVVQIAVFIQLQGPAPRPESAADTEFSEARARNVLRRILGDESPHPPFSAANNRVCDRIIKELEVIGATVDLDHNAISDEERAGYAEYYSIAPNEVQSINVLGTLPNSAATGRPVMLVSHYDTAPQAAGAGDSCGNVAAILECARALSKSGTLNCPVHVLLTDHEEGGLIGAKEFAARHGELNPIVLNCDAQGSSGPSLMIETHVDNLSLMQAVARSHARPFFAGSIFVSIYRIISGSNGRTDFSEFLRADWEGLNFVYVGSRENYHAETDTIENLSPRTLQHVGQNLLSISRGLAQADELPTGNGQGAVFFDVLGLQLLVAPTTVCLPLGVVVLLISSFLMVRSLRGRSLSGPRTFFRFFIACVAAITIAMAVGMAIPRLSVLIEPYPRLPPNQPFAAAMALAGMAACLCGGLLMKHVPARVCGDVVNTVGALFGVLLAAYEPAMSYLILVPVGVSVLTRFLPQTMHSVVTVGAAGLILLPVFQMLPHALGAPLAFLICTVYAVFCPILWGPLFCES